MNISATKVRNLPGDCHSSDLKSTGIAGHWQAFISFYVRKQLRGRHRRGADGIKISALLLIRLNWGAMLD